MIVNQSCPSTRRWHRSSVPLPGEASPPPSSSAGTRPGRVQPLAQKHETRRTTPDPHDNFHNNTMSIMLQCCRAWRLWRSLKSRGVANSAGKVEIFLLDLTGSLLVHLLLSPWVVLSAVFMVKVEAKLWLAVCSLSSLVTHGAHSWDLIGILHRYCHCAR